MVVHKISAINHESTIVECFKVIRNDWSLPAMTCLRSACPESQDNYHNARTGGWNSRGNKRHFDHSTGFGSLMRFSHCVTPLHQFSRFWPDAPFCPRSANLRKRFYTVLSIFIHDKSQHISQRTHNYQSKTTIHERRFDEFCKRLMYRWLYKSQNDTKSHRRGSSLTISNDKDKWHNNHIQNK